MTLADAALGECIDAPLDEGGRDAAPAMAFRDGDVLQIAAATIGSTECRSDDYSVVDSHEAQSMVPHEIRGKWLALVGVTDRDTFGGAPERDDAVVVIGNERADDDVRMSHG